MIKLIGIRFGDNDFYNLFDGWFALFHKRGVGYYQDLNKKKIANLFNKSASGVYWLYQNGLEYNLEHDPSNYLKIKSHQIYIDDEVTRYINDEKEFKNGEFFVLCCQTGNFWAV